MICFGHARTHNPQPLQRSKLIVTFAILILVLLLRPEGLMNRSLAR